MINRGLLIGASLLALTAVDVSSAYAQIDEIIVTARKREESLQTVPVSVTAFTGAGLEARNLDQVVDISKFTPGLYLRTSNGNSSALNLSLRGQYQNDILATLEPSVGLYVDELYWARAYGLNTNLLDLEQVQVLRGPQGTLFGQNTTGGAILFTTADPHFDGVSGKVSATYGRFDEAAAMAVINVPIIEDVFAVRGAFQVQQRDGYTTDLATGDKYNGRDVAQGRIKALLKPVDILTLEASAEWWNSEQHPGRGQVFNGALTNANTPGGAAAATAYANGVLANPDLIQLNRDPATGNQPFQDGSAQTYQGKAILDTPAGDLKLIGGYRQVDTQNLLDLDGSPAQFFETGLVTDLDQWSLELQLGGDTLDGRLNYVLGATYFEESGFDNSLSYKAGPLRSSTFVGIIDNSSWGVYAQGSYELTDALSVTAGIRYSEDTKGIINANQAFDGASPPAPPPTGILFGETISCQDSATTPPLCVSDHREASFNDYSYTLGLDYQITDTILVYAKTSKGYRSGGHQLRAVGGVTNNAFTPEVAYEHEVGFKGDLFDNHLRINTSVFYNTLDDFQRSVILVGPAGNLTTNIQNAQKARNYGADIEVTANLFEGFNFNAGASYIDQKYKEFVVDDLVGFGPGGAIIAPVDHTKDNFIGIPETEFFVGADYTVETQLATFGARVDYAWTGHVHTTQNSVAQGTATPEQEDLSTAPSGGEVNARLSATFEENIEIALWGRNLADNRDREACLAVFSRSIACSFREPRTVGVTATYSFGE